MSTAVLEPLLDRYRGRMPDDFAREENPDEVVLMPLVLRIERHSPPRRTDVLEAAASAAPAVCLDERSEPGGPWHDAVSGWISGRIRKVARRARGSHWRAVEALPGRTSALGSAEVRAFPPARVAELSKELSRLQISGSEVEPDEPGPPEPGSPTLWLNPHAPMSTGKAAAQVGHAAMFLAALLHGDGLDAELETWWKTGLPCSVRTADHDTWRRLHPGDEPPEAWRRHRFAAVRDAGFTEVDPGTVTVLAEWPLD